MKKFSLGFILLMAFTACQVEELASVKEVLPDSNQEMCTYYVGSEQNPETRTSIDEYEVGKFKILWSEGDKMNIFFGINNDQKQAMWLEEGWGTPNGIFYGPYIATTNPEDLHQTVLVYPYSKDNTCTPNEAKDAYTVNLTIPDIQEYTEGTYAVGSAPMVGVTKNPKEVVVETKNITSSLRFRLKGKTGEETISKIVLFADGLELAGVASVSASADNAPVTTFVSGKATNYVELVCPEEGVKLSNEAATDFYVTFAPCKGILSAKIYDTKGGYMLIENITSNPHTFERNKIYGYKHTYDYEHTTNVVDDLVEAFAKGGSYKLPMDIYLNRTSGLTLKSGKELDLDLNGYTLTTNCGGTQITVEKSALRISNGTIKHRNRGQYLFDTKQFNQESVLELTDVNVECLTSVDGYFLRIYNNGTNVVLNNTNIAASARIFRWSGANPDQTLPGITINGGKFKAPVIFKDIEGNVPVTFNGGLFSENESYKKGVKWVETGDEAYPWTPVALSTVMMNGVGYNTIQEAINDATTGGEVIAVAEGTYTEILDIRGGKNFTIQPQEGANVTIAGVAHESNGSATTAIFNNITFDNSLQTEGWFIGTAPNIKPCVGTWGGNLTFNGCTFNVAGTKTAETGVMTWWTTDKGALKFSECTFNGSESSARAMQIYGNMDLTVSQCTFNTPYRYSLKYVGDETTAVLTNNTVNNAQYMVELGSSAYPGNAYEVTISGSVLVEGIENFKVANVEEQIVNGVEYSKYPVRANGNKYITVAEAIAGTTGDVDITIKDGTYNLPTSGFTGRNITFVGESKDGSVIDMSAGTTPQYGASSVTFKNLTMKRKAGDYGGFSHSSAEYYDGCIIEGTLVTYAPVVEVKNTVFVPDATKEFYNVHIYGEGSSSFENCTFTTTACRSVYAYAESAKEMNISFKKCKFNSLTDAGRDYRYHQAIRIHTELGIHGTLTVEECEATGFNPAHNNGLWVEWNNNTKVPTDNFYKVIDGVAYVASAANFNKALSQDIEEIKVVLTSDVTVKGGTSTAYGSANTTKVTIEGNENTLTYEDSYRTYIGLANPDAVLVLKDMNLTRSTTGGTHWHDNNMKFECNTQMTNVKFNKGICLDDAKTFNLKNVTVSKDKVSTYAVFVTAGCDATFDGCTFTGTASDRRGIKVADEDVADKTQLTKLTISNSTFNTASKAAVLVTSEGGANVVWGEGNDISNVAADQTNAVWVDEDRPDSFDLVTVTGCTKIMEP